MNTDTRQTEHSFTDPDSETKQYQHSSTKYHHPHCTAYAYSDTQLGFLTMLETLTVVLVYNSWQAGRTATTVYHLIILP